MSKRRSDRDELEDALALKKDFKKSKKNPDPTARALRTSTLKKSEEHLDELVKEKSKKIKKKKNVGKRNKPRIPFNPGGCGRLTTWPSPKALTSLRNLDTHVQDYNDAVLANDVAATAQAKADRKKEAERLGEEGAKWYLCTLLKKDIPDNLTDDGKAGSFSSWAGAHTVDVFYEDYNGNVYVLEAKGGSAKLKAKSRVGVYPPNVGKALNQGDLNYLEDEANAMVHSGVAGKQRAGQKILDAINAGNGSLNYIVVNADYDKNSNPSKNLITPTHVQSIAH